MGVQILEVGLDERDTVCDPVIRGVLARAVEQSGARIGGRHGVAQPGEGDRLGARSARSVQYRLDVVLAQKAAQVQTLAL